MGNTGRTPTNTSRFSALLLRSKHTPNSGSSMRPQTNCSSRQFHRLDRFPLWAVLLARADEVIELATVLLAQADRGCHAALSRSIALRVVIIFRMTATMMTLDFLSAAARRLWKALRAGL